jgi:hypothetical protein
MVRVRNMRLSPQQVPLDKLDRQLLCYKNAMVACVVRGKGQHLVIEVFFYLNYGSQQMVWT